ncbi:ABC transporter substrate-binding protein [Methylobacterium terrae]|uniref:ABC transporter substrate-binding protein n=2 Tax=Methylobacterium terrae TaxID=2202827 RepID=A0A2U8WI57_9HYPH|nr:ABC transporter substrate-binding protein [Methylobacterium terrae]
MGLIHRRTALPAIAAVPFVAAPFVRRAAAAEFSLKIAHPLAAAHPTNTRLLEAADRIAKDTDGRVELRIFPNGQLGGEADTLSQLRSGAVEGYVIGGLVVSTVVPAAALDGTGFAFSDASKVWPAMDGKLGAHIRDAFAKSNLYAARTSWDLGFREITTSVKPIRTVADLSGLKIRVPSAAAYTSLFKALDAAPTSVQFTDVYPALQTRIVDAQENPLSLIVTSRFHEVQKFCSLSNHIWQGNWVLFNGRVWKGIPEALQEIVESRLNEAGRAQRNDLAGLEQSYRDTMVRSGIAFNDVDADSFRAKLRSAGYYTDVRRKFGDQAFQILEEAAGASFG